MFGSNFILANLSAEMDIHQTQTLSLYLSGLNTGSNASLFPLASVLE